MKYYRYDAYFGTQTEITEKQFNRKINSKYIFPVWDSYWQEHSKEIEMIGQIDIFGNDKVQTAIKRLQTFEPPEGYYLAFSGGKDSVCIKALADMAGVKYDAHYHLTSVDAPDLVQFVKSFPDVIIDRPKYADDFKRDELRGKQITMWNLIPYKVTPPIRITRYCCYWLKEHGGEGRFVVTGVRKAESVKRAKHRGGAGTRR